MLQRLKAAALGFIATIKSIVAIKLEPDAAT